MENSVLDSREEITKIDKSNVLGSVEAFADQCLDAWSQASKITVPDYYEDVTNIVMTGMGGSGLGARVIESVFAENLSMPLTRVNDYDLPGYTGIHSLVICSSYSGSTEETLSNVRQAIEKKAKWMAIGTGGELIDLAKQEGVPFYKINPRHNPSSQPRMAIGYSVIGELVLASKAGLFKLERKDLEKAVSTMQKVKKEVGVGVETKLNLAKKLANNIIGKNVIYVSSRHLVGAMHTVNNQLNENAKTISFDYQLPELNHHLMEGLKNPNSNKENLFVFFVNSKLYPNRIRKRLEVTRDVVEQNKIDNFVYEIKSETKLSQAFELIQFGSFVNLYLSVLLRQDPAPIPWVDYFKLELAKP